MGMGQELNDFANGFKTGFSLGDKYNARKDNMAIAAGYESRADYDKAQKIKEEGGDPSYLKNPRGTTTPTTTSTTGTGDPNAGGEGTSDGHKANSGDTQADLVLDKIRPIEGGTKDPYNTAAAHQKVGRLTGMTAQQWLDNVYPTIKGTRVMGAYQFKDSTLRGLIEKGKLDASTVMTPNVQDQMGLQLMKGRGWDEFKSGKISAQQFMGNMSQEWASLPDPNNGGRSHYKNESLGISLNAFGKVLDGIKGGATSTGQGGDQQTADGTKPTKPADTTTDATSKPTAASNFGKNLLTPEEAQKRTDAGETISTGDIQGAAPSAASPQQTSAIPQRTITGGGPTDVAMANARQGLASSDDEDTDQQGQQRQQPQSRGAAPIEVAQLDPTTPTGAPSVTSPMGPVLGPLPPPSVDNPSGIYTYAARGGVMQRPRRLGFAAGGAAPTNADQQGSGRAYTQALPASTAGPAPAQGIGGASAGGWTPRMIGQVAPGGGNNQPATSGSQAKFAAAQAAVQSQIDARNAAAAQAPVQAQVDQGPFSHQAYIESQNRYNQSVAPISDPQTPPNRFRDVYQAPRPYMDEASWQTLQPGYQQWAQQNNVGQQRSPTARGYADGGFVGGFASGLATGYNTGRRGIPGRRRKADTPDTSTPDTSTDGSYNRGYMPDDDDSGSYNRGLVQNAAGGGLMKGYGQKSSSSQPDDDDRKDRADRKSAPRSDESRPPAGTPYQEGGTGKVDAGVPYDPSYSLMPGGGPSPPYDPNDYDAKPSGMTMPELHELGDTEDRRRRAASGIPLAHRNVSAASGVPGTNNVAEPHKADFPTPDDPGYKRPDDYDTDRKPSDIVSSGTTLADIDTSEMQRRKSALPRTQEDRDLRSSRAAALARLEARDKAYAQLDKTQGDRATRAGTEDQPTTPESTAQGEEGAGKVPTPPPRPSDIDQQPTPPTPPVRTAQATPPAPGDGTPAPSPIPTPPPRPAILGDASGVAPAAQGMTPSQVPGTPPDQAATPPTPPVTPLAPPTASNVISGTNPKNAAPVVGPNAANQPAVTPPDTTPGPSWPPKPKTIIPGSPAASPVPTPSQTPPVTAPTPPTAANVPLPPPRPSDIDQPVTPPPAKPGTKVKQPGIVTHKEIQESTKAGLGSINKGLGAPAAGTFNRGFGAPAAGTNRGMGIPTRDSGYSSSAQASSHPSLLGGQAGGQPGAGTMTPAMHAFANNDNAIDPRTMQNLQQQVDPEGKLSNAERMMKVQQDLYDFYMAHGYQTKAAGVAAGVLMYGRRISQLAGNMAQAALEHGDTATASAWMAKAYENMPDGHELRVSKPDAQGNVQYQLVDLESGEAGEIKTATPDDMLTMAKSMSSGALWASSTIGIAQGSGVGVGGGGVGKGGRGSRSPGTLTQSQQLTQEQKAKVNDAMDGLGTAIDAYKNDQSDDNKAAVIKAAQDARTAGGNSSNISGLLKEAGLAPAAPTKLTEKERTKQAADEQLQKKLDAEPDPDKKNGILADDTYERAKEASKGKQVEGKLEDAFAEQEVDDDTKKILAPLVSSFAKANNMDASTAVASLMAIVKGKGFQFVDGKVQVDDTPDPVYINTNIIKALLKARATVK